MTDSTPPNPRRRFLGWLWASLGLLATAEVAWVVSGFFRPRSSKRGANGDDIITLGPVEGFAPGSVTAVPAGRFYLVRLEDGGFLALDRECTHLGCTVPWSAETGRFDCPCHASSFALDGAVLGPPAPRPLDSHPVRIENGQVKVITGRRVRRNTGDPAPVVYAG